MKDKWDMWAKGCQFYKPKHSLMFSCEHPDYELRMECKKEFCPIQNRWEMKDES